MQSPLSTIKSIWSILAMPFLLPLTNRQLRKQLDRWEIDAAFDDIHALNEQDLKSYVESEWIRAKDIDEKLAKLTVTLSLAVTVGGAIAKTIVDGLQESVARTATISLLCFSMGYFLYGAWIGFQGLRPKPRFGYGARYLRSLARGGDEATNSMRYAACGFQVMNLVRSNEASAAIDLIRNGILFYAAAIMISFLVPTENSVDEIPPAKLWPATIRYVQK